MLYLLKCYLCIKKFKDENPKVIVSLVNVSIQEAFVLLKGNKIDLIIYPRDVGDNCPIEIDKIEIKRFTTYWVFYKGHPLENKNEKDITLEDIASYPFGIISLGQDVYIQNFLKTLLAHIQYKRP